MIRSLVPWTTPGYVPIRLNGPKEHTSEKNAKQESLAFLDDVDGGLNPTGHLRTPTC